MKDKKVTAIILVAGNSTRYGQNRNKNLENISGKTILEYSLDKFNKNPNITDIIITCKKDELDFINGIIYKSRSLKPIKTVIGGNSRKESVFNSINSTNSDIVIIHDGARPMIKDSYINNSIHEMNNYKGVTIGVKSKDTIKIADENGIIKSTTKRENTWIIQTPQCFDRLTLINAHNHSKDDSSITDDCMLLENYGETVKIIPGDYTNIKLTTYDDLNIVNGLFKNISY